MQMATSIETDNGEMIVKRVSVPIGLEELMEGLTKEVMLKKPKDIYVFASQYFANLLDLREKGAIKGISGKKTQSVSKHIIGDGVGRHLKKKSKSIEPVKQLAKQISIRSESPVKKAISAKKITLTPKEDKSDKTKSFIDKRKARKGSKDSNGSDKQTSTADKSEKKTRERSTSDGRKSKTDSCSVKTTPRQQNQTKTNQEKSSKGNKKPVEKAQEDNSNKRKSKEIEIESLAKAGGILQTSKDKIDDVEHIAVKDETITEDGSVCIGCTLKDNGAVDLTMKQEPKPDIDKGKESLDENVEKIGAHLDRSVDEVDSKEDIKIDDKVEATSGGKDDQKIEDISGQEIDKADNENAKETLSSKEETSVHENNKGTEIKEQALKSETLTGEEIIRSKRSISVDAGNGEKKAEQLTQQKSFDSAQLHEEIKQVNEETSAISFNPLQLREEIKKASEEGKFETETKFGKIASEVKAAIKIQSMWRGFSVRKNKNRDGLLKEIPSSVDGEKDETIKGKEESKEEKHKDEIAKAVMKIQALWRGFKIRKHLKNSKLFGSTIESPVKREETLRDIDKINLEKAASIIQAVWRGFKVRKNIREVDERLKELQKPAECDEMPHQRGLSDEDIHKAATKIQAGVRGYMVRKEKRNNNRLNSITEEPLEEALQEEKVAEGLINTGELHDSIVIEEKDKHKTSETSGTSSSDDKANMNLLTQTESEKTDSAKEKSQSDKTELSTEEVATDNREKEILEKEILEKNNNEKLINEESEKEKTSSDKDEHFNNKMENKDTKEALNNDSDKENIDMKIAQKLLETPLKMSTQNISNKESDSKFAEDNKQTEDIGVEQTADKEIYKNVELGETGNQLSKNKSDDTEEDNKKTENQVEFIAPELNFPTTNKLSSSDTSEIIDDSISKNIVNKDDAGPISFPDYEAAPTRPVTSDVLQEPAQEDKDPNNADTMENGNRTSLKKQERILNEESSTSVDSTKTVILNGTLGSTESNSDIDVEEKKLKHEKTKDRLESEENEPKETVKCVEEKQLKDDKIGDLLENEKNKFNITKMEQNIEETAKYNEDQTDLSKKEQKESTLDQLKDQSDKEKNLKGTETELSSKLNKRDNVKLSDTQLMHSGEFHDVLPASVGTQEEPLSKEIPPKETILKDTNIGSKSPSSLVNTGELHDSVLVKEKENEKILNEIESSLVAQNSDHAIITPKATVDLFKDNNITNKASKENFVRKEIAKQNEEIKKEIILPTETLNKTITQEENTDSKAIETNENKDETENEKNKEEKTGESKIRGKRSVDPLTQDLNQPQDSALVTELSKDKDSEENIAIEPKEGNNKNKLINEETKKEPVTATAALTSSSDQKKQEINEEMKFLETDSDKSQIQDIKGATKLSDKLASEVSNKNLDNSKTESRKEMTEDNDKQKEIKKDIDLPTESPNEKNTLANDELTEHNQAETTEAKIEEKDLTKDDLNLTGTEAKKLDTAKVESLKEADTITTSEQESKTGDSVTNIEEKQAGEQVSPVENLVSTSELHDGVVIETGANLSEPNEIMNQKQKIEDIKTNMEEKTVGEVIKQAQGLINSSELHDGVPIDKSINEPQSKINADDTHSSLQESKLDVHKDTLKGEITDKKNEIENEEDKAHSTAVPEKEKLSSTTTGDTSKNTANNKEQNNISNEIILSVDDKTHDKSEHKIQETENKEINKLSLGKEDKNPETVQEVTESLIKDSKLPLESTPPTIPSNNQDKIAVKNEENTTVDKDHGKEEGNKLLSNGKFSDESDDTDSANVKREEKLTDFAGDKNKIINSEDTPCNISCEDPIKKDNFEATSGEVNGSESENNSNKNQNENVKDDTNKTVFDISALKKEIASYTKDPLEGIETITNGHILHDKKEETENIINSMKDNEIRNHKLNTDNLNKEIMKSNEQLKEMIIDNKSNNLLEKINMGKSETSPDISTTDETITESTLSTLSSNSESNKLNIQQLNEEIKNKLSQQSKGEKVEKFETLSQTSMRKLSGIKEENPNLKLSIESTESLESEWTNNENHKDPEGTIETDEPSKKQLDGNETAKVDESTLKSTKGKLSASEDQEVSINKENGEMERPTAPITVEIKAKSTPQDPSEPSNQKQEMKTPPPAQITIGGDDSVHISGTNVNLVHSSELHDTITVPVSITPPQKPSSPESPPKTDPQTPPQGLVSSGELHDNVVPLSVQLNEAAPAGAEVLTSHVSESVGGRAQASNKDASTCEARSDTETSSPASMETEKRNNASIPKKSMEVEAATKIQAGFRGYQVRKQLKNKNSASGDISNQRRSARRKSSGRITESGRINNKVKNSSELEEKEKSAVKIQAGVRGFLVRRRQKKQKQGKESA